MAKELRFETLVESEHVVQHQHLTVAFIAGTDTDNRTRNVVGHTFGQRGRNLLQYNRETARFVQQLGVVQQFLGFCFFFGTQTVSAELVDTLRGKTQMSHHRHTGLNHMADSRQDLFAAFEFDGIAAALFENLNGIADCLFFAHLIAAERHIADNERVLRGSYHTFGEENHLVHGNRQRVLVSAHYIAGAIAYQKHIDTRFVHQRSEGEIITGQHSDFLAVSLHLTQFSRSHTAVLYMNTHSFFVKKRTKVLLFFEMCKKKCIFALEMQRKPLIFVFLGLLLVLLFGLDVCSGSIWLWPFGELSPMEQQIIHSIRLPKALTAILAGSALSIAGLVMQTLFRNPLAGPYTLGVSSGASLGVAFLTMLGTIFQVSHFQFQISALSLPFAAVIGASLVLLLVLAVSRRVTNNVSLLIVGLMFGSIAGALVSLLQNFANPDALKLFIVWTLGSLSSVGWSDMQMMVPVLLLGGLFALLALKPLNGLLLGEDYARGLGINVERTRLYIVLATGLLAGGVTAFCGPIAFVGVAVPHIARGLLRSSNHRLTMPASALIGACLLLVCDVLCSLAIYPLPISTVSALFGAPVIIWIILKK